MSLQRTTSLSAPLRTAMFGTTSLFTAATSQYAVAQNVGDKESSVTAEEAVEVIKVTSIRGARANVAEIKAIQGI